MLGERAEIKLDFEQIENGLLISAGIKYPSSLFWWIFCLIGIPMGWGLGMAAIFLVMDFLRDPSDRGREHFQKTLEFAKQSVDVKQEVVA